MKNLFFIICLCGWLEAHSQNVGIGTITPAVPLHLKGTTAELLRLESNSPYIGFFNGTGTYSGYLWYNNSSTSMELGTAALSNKPVVIAPNVSPMAFFTSNGRLGLGISTPSERLDVNGSINLTGLLKVNGSSGMSGQVLSSNGTGDPTWKNTALSNATRFAANVPSADEAAPLAYTTIYNLTPADVTIGPANITINKTGLYHFDVHMHTAIRFSSGEPDYVYMGKFIIADGNTYPIDRVNPGWKGIFFGIHEYGYSSKYTIDLHLTAPAVVTLSRSFSYEEGSATYQSRTTSGWISGYLISE